MTQATHYEAPIDDAAEQATSQFVTFRLDQQHYCVDIMSVREIRMMAQLTAVPGAPPHIRGVINLRGTLIPISDVRYRFNNEMTDISEKHPVVIVSLDGRLTGLLVDEVLDIISVREDELLPLPESHDQEQESQFENVISRDQRMTIVISLTSMFSDRGEA